MTRRCTPTCLLLTSALLLGACQQHSDTIATAATAATPADAWIGNWNGPEGTALEVIAADHGYRVSIQSLDGRSYYDAKWAGNHLEFTRAGRTEFIRHTDGAGTGMKWLADKHDCLTIVTGEAFCRT